jgi:predicted SprT family Zn-dependent metalloprotease
MKINVIFYEDREAEDCDNEMHYNRAGKVVKQPWVYSCGKCDGSLVVIQNW